MTKYWIVVAILTSLVVAEMILRFGLGLGSPVLSQADSEMGYRFQPNQKVVRFGRRVEYNQYSQRSEPVGRFKPKDTLRILMIGDSVLNGTNYSDQSETIAELLEAKIVGSGQAAEVLNASAYSWGIGNQFGYIKKFGLFDSDALILQVGTHDLVQSTSVGDDLRENPESRPWFAIQEAIFDYVIPRLMPKTSENNAVAVVSDTEMQRQFEENLQLLAAIAHQARQQEIPVFVLYTPNRADLLPVTEFPLYKKEFLQFLDDLDILVIDTHAAWSSLPATTLSSYFRDWVHLSVPANQAIADLLFEELCLESSFPAC
ncbi:MAG: SGNH/GDSL hydrolase family protein [Oscillatoria sp. PMC 1076.18]|nr:SGNH/GDSL hydrolase family protein [Oscillatoria sp. PMC 1076.18]